MAVAAPASICAAAAARWDGSSWWSPRSSSRSRPFQTTSTAWTRDVLHGVADGWPVTLFRYLYRITDAEGPAVIRCRIAAVERRSLAPGLDPENEDFDRRYR